MGMKFYFGIKAKMNFLKFPKFLDWAIRTQGWVRRRWAIARRALSRILSWSTLGWHRWAAELGASFLESDEVRSGERRPKVGIRHCFLGFGFHLFIFWIFLVQFWTKGPLLLISCSSKVDLSGMASTQGSRRPQPEIGKTLDQVLMQMIDLHTTG
jgi:hypothetical protein